MLSAECTQWKQSHFAIRISVARHSYLCMLERCGVKMSSSHVNKTEWNMWSRSAGASLVFSNARMLEIYLCYFECQSWANRIAPNPWLLNGHSVWVCGLWVRWLMSSFQILHGHWRSEWTVFESAVQWEQKRRQTRAFVKFITFSYEDQRTRTYDPTFNAACSSGHSLNGSIGNACTIFFE